MKSMLQTNAEVKVVVFYGSLVFLRAEGQIKNKPCDVIKIGEINVEVGKKSSKREMENPSFL